MPMPIRFALAAALIGLAAPATAQTLTFIGQQTLPAGYQAFGTTVGGLSGIDYDAATGNFVAISDDRSAINPARYYDLDLALTSTAFTGVSFTGVHTLRQPSGAAYAANGLDPESIRLGGSHIIYSSEGDANAGQMPFIREANRDGGFIRDFTVPAYYNPTAGYGIRNNLAFESLTLSNDGGSIITGLENALNQDGPAASLTTGSPSRLLVLDRLSGLPTSEFVYQNTPLAESPVPASNFGVNGLVELLGMGGDDYLAVERSYSVGAPGTGYSIKLYTVNFDGATNVLGRSDLDSAAYTPVTKTLLFDFGTLGIPLDNIEGVTFGPTLENGERSLVLVSDDNFSNAQFQQFLAFRISGAVPEPASWTVMIGGFGVVGGAMRGRRKRVALVAG